MGFYLGLESLQGNAISRAEYLEGHGVLPWTGEPARQHDLESRIPRGPWGLTLDWRACKATRSPEQNTKRTMGSYLGLESLQGNAISRAEYQLRTMGSYLGLESLQGNAISRAEYLLRTMGSYLGLESLQGNAISRAEYLEDHGVLTWTGEPARQRDLESRIPTEDHGILP